jgi:hypothetical protein
MTENERLAQEMLNEIHRAEVRYLMDEWSAEQLITRLRQIFKAAHL